MTEKQRLRSQGTLLGLACGDALGRPVEFRSPDRIVQDHGRVIEMLANGTHGQPSGTITGDTEMALRIARSLAEHGTFVPADLIDRFVAWKASGPFDIGIMTADSLRLLDQGDSWDEAGRQIWEASPEGSNARNGSLMRCAPYAIAYRDRQDKLVEASKQSSAITHADPRCQWSFSLFNRTLANLLNDVDRPLKTTMDALESRVPDELREAVHPVLECIHGEQPIIELANSGYVVTTLQAGLYYGLTGKSTNKAIIDAVMMGGDTDTIGAVTGAIAGARFGSSDLPDRWVAEINEADELRELATDLHGIGGN